MTDGEPATLLDPNADASAPPIAIGASDTEPTAAPAPVQQAQPRARRDVPEVHVVGFWRRAAAAAIDLAVVIPAALIVTWIVSKVAGVHLPPSNLGLFDVDLWIDLVLATDPALVMAFALVTAIGLVYLLVFHIIRGRTLGMQVMKLRVIDVYGDPPAPARCALRSAAYLASAATLGLGFLWIGFDSEKRGLHDWIASTYVIRA